MPPDGDGSEWTRWSSSSSPPACASPPPCSSPPSAGSCPSAGVFAVGLEGMMLAGAFAGVIVGHGLGSLGAGLAASIVGGALIALVVAIATVRFGADQMVTGLAVNILAVGLTSFLLRGLFA